jgi:hypothetical protein
MYSADRRRCRRFDLARKRQDVTLLRRDAAVGRIEMNLLHRTSPRPSITLGSFEANPDQAAPNLLSMPPSPHSLARF